jgi:hypothetical protein
MTAIRPGANFLFNIVVAHWFGPADFGLFGGLCAPHAARRGRGGRTHVFAFRGKRGDLVKLLWWTWQPQLAA